jgi:hypothetical protein
VFSMAVPPERLRPTTDAERRQTIDEVVARFASIFGDVQIDVVWESESLNAQAFRLGPDAHIRIYGGLARHRDIGPEGVAVAIAHEIGHHKGGEPASLYFHWLSNDKRADEWARTVGLPAAFGTAAADVARAGAEQLFGALADLAAPDMVPPCEPQEPCLRCRARAFGATGRLDYLRCELASASVGLVANPRSAP